MASVGAAQRKKPFVNLIWEITQALIAVSVTVSTLVACLLVTMRNLEDKTAFLLLANAFFLVIGFYFGKTHAVTEAPMRSTDLPFPRSEDPDSHNRP